MRPLIRAGDTLTFKPEWADEGDALIRHTAAQDEDGGRVLVRSHIGFSIEPTSVCTVDMIATVNGQPI